MILVGQPKKEPSEGNSCPEDEADYRWDDKKWAVPSQSQYPHWYANNSDYQADENRYWRRSVWAQWSGVGVAIATLIIVVIGAYTAYCAFIQTKSQADAAWKQVGISKETEIRQLRAYLVVVPTEGEKVLDWETGDPRYKMTFSNEGQTPIYNLFTYSKFYVAPYSPSQSVYGPGDAEIPQCGDRKMSSGDAGIIGVINHPFVGKKIPIEGGGDDRRGRISIPKERLDRFANEQHALFLIGRACYEDIFKQNDYTAFCFVWQKKDGIVGDARPCFGNGNRADRNPEK
jgi:hypothetical protein